MTSLSIASHWPTSALPTMFLIDQDGKVVSRNINGVGLETEVKKLLK